MLTVIKNIKLREILAATAIALGGVLWGQLASAQSQIVRENWTPLGEEPATVDVAAMKNRAESGEAFTFESDNFVMSGRIDKEGGQALLADLESFRAAVLLAIGEDYAAEPEKLEVFYAADNEDFEFTTNRPGAGGIYRRTFEAPVFVINGYSGGIGDFGHRQIAYHELTHHLLGSYYHGTLPVWLGEGLAEYFSAYERADDGTVTMGMAMPENIEMLSSFDWMTPRTLLESIHDYPFRSMRQSGNGFSYVDFFYAQSWLAAHYFQSDNARLEKLSEFNRSLDPVMDSEEIFSGVFGFNYAMFEKSLRAYLAAADFTAQSFVSPKGPADFAMTITPLTTEALLFRQAEAARKMIDGDQDGEPLLALYTSIENGIGQMELAQARARAYSDQRDFVKAAEFVDAALSAAPDDSEAKRTAGVILMSKSIAGTVPNPDDIKAARGYLRAAIKAAPDNVEAHYYYALSYVMTGDDAPASVLTSVYKSEAYLRGAGFATQRMFLAPILMQHKKYKEARPLIEEVLKWSDDYQAERTARQMSRMLDRLESGF